MAQEIQEPTQEQILEALRIVRDLADADAQAIASIKEMTSRFLRELDDADATKQWCEKQINARETSNGE